MSEEDVCIARLLDDSALVESLRRSSKRDSEESFSLKQSQNNFEVLEVISINNLQAWKVPTWGQHLTQVMFEKMTTRQDSNIFCDAFFDLPKSTSCIENWRLPQSVNTREVKSSHEWFDTSDNNDLNRPLTGPACKTSDDRTLCVIYYKNPLTLTNGTYRYTLFVIDIHNIPLLKSLIALEEFRTGDRKWALIKYRDILLLHRNIFLRAASTIACYWRLVYWSPYYQIGRKRIMREYVESSVGFQIKQ